MLRVQKELYLKLKDCAKQFFGGLSPEMRRYYREYTREFSNLSSLSNSTESLHSEMLDALESAQIAICGDYHTLSQAQRTVIRISRDLLPTLRNQKRKLVIGLELASPDHDALLHKYVAGKVSEEALGAGLDFERRWGFPWENYSPLFQFAKTHRIALVGISPSPRPKRPSLEERDAFAASVVANHSAKDPATLMIVMMGDLHLASAHLPRALKAALEKKDLQRELVVIHQNNESLYWELAELGLDDRVDVVKIRNGVYCLLNTPPWVKLQSHLKWAELISEQEANEDEIERSWSEALNEVDHVEEVNGLLTSILTFLRLKAKGLENRFSVHGPDSREQILESLERFQFTAVEIKRIREYLGEFQSVYVPRASYLCLAEPSLNHEARLAAIFLHASLSRFEKVFTEPRSDFYRFVMVEALGFFGSKVINPRRKSRTFDDLHRFLSDKIKDKDARKVARFCLSHWEIERKYFTGKGVRKYETFPDVFRGQKPFQRSALLSYKASKVLGKALGEALYAAVIDGKIDRKLVATLFHLDFSELDSKGVLALYLRWARRLDRLGYRLRKSPSHGKK